MKLAAAFLCLAFGGALAAADVAGKWVAQVPGRDGQTRETTFTFKVDGAKLTGTMATQMGETQISDGKIEGDNLSFSVQLSFGGNDIKLLFKGKVSGDEIKFTREREGGQGRAQEFTAKRAVT
jgi:hypothetical protein